MLHHIQKAILNNLATVESLRYSELKPDELDGNVFGYHLKQLIADKYVAKTDDGDYSLTLLGRNYIVHRYEDPLAQAHTIFLIVIRRGDSWLMRRRLVQPLLGMSGFVHGEPQAGTRTIETARERLKDKTGLDVDLQIYSGGLITIRKNNQIESYSHAIILSGTTTDDVSIGSDATGEQFWSTIQDVEAHQDEFLPSCLAIMQRIEAGDMSYFELSY